MEREHAKQVFETRFFSIALLVIVAPILIPKLFIGLVKTVR